MEGRARVAENLRRIRTERGLTQDALAVDAAVDRTYVGGIERKKFSATVDVLEKLAGALGVDMAMLLQPIDGNTPKNEGLKRGRKPGPR